MGSKVTSVLVACSLIVIALGIYGAFHLNPQNASMGDWGDYVGGLIGVLTLIWLVAGHIQTQLELKDTKADLRAQFELTQEAVGALTRIASGTQVQAAEVLQAAEPHLVHLSSTPIAKGMQKFQMKPMVESGYLALRNDGGAATVERIESLCEDFTGSYDGPYLLAKGTAFKIIAVSTKPLSQSGPLHLRVHMRDKFGRVAVTEIITNQFGESPTIRQTAEH